MSLPEKTSRLAKQSNPDPTSANVGTRAESRRSCSGSHVIHKPSLRFWTFGLFCCVALASTWLLVRWSPSHAPRDYEECLQDAEGSTSSRDERSSLVTRCGVRFAGRRKMGGGYTYYDFMQNRHFDISGPNPTPEELRQIDHAYTAYLDVQRRDLIAAEIAKKQNEQAQIEVGTGPPMVITPTNLPAAGAKAPPNRLREARCADGSWSCNWSKFSAGWKDVFGSAAKPKP